MTIGAVTPKGSNWDEMMWRYVRCLDEISFSSNRLERLADTVLFCNIHGIPTTSLAFKMLAGDRARYSGGNSCQNVLFVETHLVRLTPSFCKTQRRSPMCWMASEMVSVY